MKIASIHTNSIHNPFNFESSLLKSSSVTCSKNIPVRVVLRRSHSLFSGGACDRRYNHSAQVFLKTASGRAAGGRAIAHNYATITCARRTESEQEAFTSPREASNYQSADGIDENKSLCDDNSGSIAGEVASRSADYVSSLRTVGLCVFSAVAFGVGVGFIDGVGKASEFFAGYLLEQSLSVDNLFVFVLVFKYFKVPLNYQPRVLSYGIAGAIIFRLTLILLGTATLQRFEAVNLLLAAVLLYSSFKLFAEDDEDTDLSENLIVKTCQKVIPVTPNYDGNRFITKQDGVWKATPLLLTVAVIELSDIAFAVDSIPAVFGVTRDPFIVFSSNLFAILGLRSYYTLISESMGNLEYLQPAIGVVLGFIGCKMILDFFGFHVTTEVSLGVVAASLMTGVLLSLVKSSNQSDDM